MFLTTKGRYAVMVMAELASDSSARPISSQILASRLGIDAVYIEQILAKLKMGQMVRSTRGPGGGYSLIGNSSEIKILDIMTVADESLKMTKCTVEQGIGCLNKGKRSVCNSHHLWADLEKQITDFLNKRTLASLVEKKDKSSMEEGHEFCISRS